MSYLRFEAIAKVNKKLAYAASGSFNALFKVDLETGKSCYLQQFDAEKMDAKRLYTNAIYVNNKVYFVPAAAEKIAVLDVKTNVISYIDINEVDENRAPNYRNDSKFNSGVLYDGWIYMISCTYPAIVRVNIDNHTVEYFEQWIDGQRFLFRRAPFVEGKYFYIPSVINNLVLEFDMDCCEGKLYRVGKNNGGCWSICKVKDDFWLSPKKNGPIIKWNPNTKCVQELGNYPSGFDGKDFCFTKIYNSVGCVRLLPMYANMGIEVDVNTGIMKRCLSIAEDNTEIYFMFELDNFYYVRVVKKKKSRYMRINLETWECEDFAFEFAKRSEYSNIKTTALNAPNSQRNKVINSYNKCSYLIYDSGESYSKIKANIKVDEEETRFNGTIEIGTSIRFSMKENTLENIIKIIDYTIP